jgi:hypothetical protein
MKDKYKTRHALLCSCIQGHIAKTNRENYGFRTVQGSSFLWRVLSPTLPVTPPRILIFRGLWRHCYWHFCLQRQPICWLWVYVNVQTLDFASCMTQNHWHSVDALLMLCWHSVDTVLMLLWRSVLGYFTNAVESVFGKQDGLYFDSGLMLQHTCCIFCDAWPIIVDAPLTVIFRTW